MKYFYIILLWCLGSISKAKGQISFPTTFCAAMPELDSLYCRYHYLVTNNKAISQQISLLHALIKKEADRDLKTTVNLVDTLALLYLKQENLYQYNYSRYELKGRIFAAHRKYIKALQYYKSYVPYCKKETLNDAYFFVDMGNVYFHLKFFKLAKRYYQEAEKIAVFQTVSEKERLLSTVYLNLSLIAREQNNFEVALEYLDKKISFEKEMEGHLYYLPYTYNALGRLYYSVKKDYDKAVDAFALAEEILRNTLHEDRRDFSYSSRSLLAEIYVFKGLSFLGRREEKIGETFIDKGLKLLADKNDAPKMQAYLSYYIANFYEEYGAYKHAKRYLKIAEKKYSTIQNYLFLAPIYETLIKVTDHNPKEQLIYWKKYGAVKDSLKNKNEALLILNEEILQKEKEEIIKQQKKSIIAEKRIKNLLFAVLFLVALLLLIVVCASWFTWSKNRVIASYANHLEQANYSKELLLSIIGHDLRVPFSTLMNSSSMAFVSIQNTKWKEAEQAVQRTNKAAKEAYIIMDGLMQWSILHKDKTEMSKPEKIALRTKINEIIGKLQTITELSGVKIQNKIPSLLYFYSDPHLLEIIIRNLLINAIRHTPLGGAIWISMTKDKSYFYIHLEDEGEGIDSYTLKHLFDNKNAISIAKKGSGLGLDIVQKLCKLLKISIFAENKNNLCGAVFSLKIDEQYIEGQTLKVVSAKSSQNTKSAFLALTLADKVVLQNYRVELEKLKLFQSSSILKIINLIEQENPSKTILTWIKAVKQSIKSYDEQQYRDLLSNIKK